MCGIFALLNNNKDDKDIIPTIELGNRRGPDKTSILNDDDTSILLGFHRLAINGLDAKSDIKCFTTDMIYDSGRGDYPRKYQEMIRECDVVDMELYAIAQVCKYYSKPLLSYKWVSDDGNPDKWEENAALGFDKFENLIKNL